MNRIRRWAAAAAFAGVAVLGLTTVGASICLAAENHDFEWSQTIPAGGFVKVKGVNGSIEARPSRDGKAHVRAVKRGRSQYLDDVRIEVEEGSRGVTICAVYPGGNGCDRLTGRSRGWWGHDNTKDVKVDFMIEVPAEARLEASTVNGNVEARGLESDTEVSTVNGSIELETSGYGEASTVNGSIVAAIGASRWPEALDFSTVNGGITLELPREPDADLRASTVNGSISTDFPLTVRGKFGRRSVRGTLGKGGTELNLSTVNGRIRLREGRS